MHRVPDLSDIRAAAGRLGVGLTAEEAEVYPKVKERISEQEAEQAKHEHAEAELTMKRLEPLRPGDRVFDEQLATLMQEIREHVAEEESQMFADLRANFSEQELVEGNSDHGSSEPPQHGDCRLGAGVDDDAAADLDEIRAEAHALAARKLDDAPHARRQGR